MSIEIENPETLLGKVDAAANLVEQIRLASSIGDKEHIERSINEAARLLREATLQLQEGTQENPYGFLAHIIRGKAAGTKTRAYAGDDDVDHIDRENAELLNCLARMLEGKEVHEAFGAPGDWGYDTGVGDALAMAYKALAE